MGVDKADYERWKDADFVCASLGKTCHPPQKRTRERGAGRGAAGVRRGGRRRADSKVARSEYTSKRLLFKDAPQTLPSTGGHRWSVLVAFQVHYSWTALYG